MSGRSAYVRKEKTKIKDGGPVLSDSKSDKAPSLTEFPMPVGHGFPQDLPIRGDSATLRTHYSNTSDDMAYARVRKPVVTPIEVSGIEKSSFRSMMDKKSEGARKALGNAFRKKKKGSEDVRPGTSTNLSRNESDEYDTGDYTTSPIATTNRPQTTNRDFAVGLRSPPPTTSLPAVPNHPTVKQWVGGKKGPLPWAKLRRDPELWDDHGDVLVYLQESDRFESGPRPRPSFRLSSHVLEALRIPSMNDMLSNNVIGGNRSSFGGGYAEDHGGGSGLIYPVQPSNRNHHSPPRSEADSDSYAGEVSYELVFAPPGPAGSTKLEIFKYHLAVRNFFALATGASLVGLSLASALTELQEWMEQTMPEIHDPAHDIMKWLKQKDLIDVRDNPSVAAGLLTWYESEGVRDRQGYLTAFCHCVGMFSRCVATPEWRYVSVYSKRMIENAHDLVETKVDACQYNLEAFEFASIWPAMSATNPPSRQACERFRQFLINHYRQLYGSWPPPVTGGSDRWLTRRVTQTLQKDFGALYDYLVNRNVTWDGTEERAGRKWNLRCNGNAGFEADTADLPFTDIIVAFDNKNQWPRIPAPYPLTPESAEVEEPARDPKEASKSSKKAKPMIDKAAERKFGLLYSGATNLYLLGDRFVENDLVEAYTRFEKIDMLGEVNPFDARRGRWVLIYKVLQILASISVDVPDCEFTDGVTYYLRPQLKGIPPWRGARQDFEEASHHLSYCWKAKESWREEPPVTLGLKSSTYSLAPSVAPSYSNSLVPPSSSRSSAAMSTTSSSDTDYTQSMRSPSSHSGYASHKGSRHQKRDVKGGPMSYSGYAPGIEKLEEEEGQWPIREGSVMYGSEAGDGSQFGGSAADMRREKLRNDALAAQRSFSRQQSNQELQETRAQAFSRQQSQQQAFKRKETGQEVRREANQSAFRRQDSSQDFRPRENSQEFVRRGESVQSFKPIQSFDAGSDDFFDGIRDFDDYRI